MLGLKQRQEPGTDGWGLESLAGVPGGGRSPQTFRQCCLGVTLGIPLSRWKGAGKNSTTGHLSPMTQLLGSESAKIY